MLNHADLVEEQELKERILEKVRLKFAAGLKVIIDDSLVDQYVIVRNRNEAARMEEYAKRY